MCLGSFQGHRGALVTCSCSWSYVFIKIRQFNFNWLSPLTFPFYLASFTLPLMLESQTSGIFFRSKGTQSKDLFIWFAVPSTYSEVMTSCACLGMASMSIPIPHLVSNRRVQGQRQYHDIRALQCLMLDACMHGGERKFEIYGARRLSVEKYYRNV